MKKREKQKKDQLTFVFQDQTKQSKANKPTDSSAKILDKSDVNQANTDQPDACHADACQSDEDFLAIFNSCTKQNWKIIWHNNKSVMITFRRSNKPPTLRLHSIFKMADELLIKVIADVIEGRRRKWSKAVSLFISKHAEIIEAGASARRPKRIFLSYLGEVFNLKEIFDNLNTKYFENKIDAKIGWSNVRVQRRLSIKLGSYSEQSNVIRMHPVLDNKIVPHYVIESIVFHEMVHVKIKTTIVNGRRIMHGQEFKNEMSKYPFEEKSDKWIKKNIGTLLPTTKRQRTRKR